MKSRHHIRIKDFEMISKLLLFMIYTTIDSQTLHFCDTNGKDECEVAKTNTPFQPNARYPHCPYDSNRQYCDRYITPGWYRYSTTMLDQCAILSSCGALYPYWLNGSHPASVNQEVIRTVCKVGFSSCCSKQVTIKIRHCGDFMAYCLPALDTCPERYCFGESGECEPPTTIIVPSTTRSSSIERSITSGSSSSTYPVTQRTSQQTTVIAKMTQLSTESPQSSSTSLSSTSSKRNVESNTIKSSSGLTTNVNKWTTVSTTDKLTGKTTVNSNFIATTSPVFDHCSNGIDPCDARNQLENVPNLVNRSDQCAYESILKPCDQDLQMKWYKGFKLLERCPRFLTCGAVYPVWMNGSEPEVKDGVVTREACVASPNNCCKDKLEIKVVNCSLYTAYCLRPLRRCEERYCFNTKTCSIKSTQEKKNINTENSLTMTLGIGIGTAVITLLIIIILVIAVKRCRDKPDSMYEKPLASPSENEYEMPATSNINTGNVYDELPERNNDTEDGFTVQTTSDENQYDYIPEET